MAGSQYEGGCQEGGRGLSTQDAVTDGGYKKPRMITYKTSVFVCPSAGNFSILVMGLMGTAAVHFVTKRVEK